MKNQGYATFLLFGVLVSISIIFLGVYLSIEYAMKEVHRSETREKERVALIEKAREVVKVLLADPTPLSNSLTDPVWQYIKPEEHQDARIMLEDVSSVYGIDWIRKDIVSQSGLLRIGKSPEEFQQFRWQTGLQSNVLSNYSDYFSSEALNAYFTLYSYFNVNICDEFALEKIVQARTGDRDKGESFRQKVQNLWSASTPGKPRMLERDELATFMGTDYETLFPVVNVEPVFNIHFVPEDILHQLFTFKHHNIPQGVFEYLITNRSNYEWSEDDLAVIIGERYKKTFLHHYFGVVTWFWRLEVTKSDSLKLRWILARVPREKTGDASIEYRLVEEEFLQ
jgi:hypothetical protein